MKKRMIATVTATLLGAVSVYGDNITINDTVGYAGGGVGGEDNEVEPGCVYGQQWDVEAFLLDSGTKTLSIKSGYNLQAGQWATGWNMMFYSGDIFIDVNNDAVWGSQLKYTDVSPNGNGYYVGPNSTYKWDYAVVFGRTSPGEAGGSSLDGTYTVVNLQSGTPSDVEVFFDANNMANPFRYLSGGTPVVSTRDYTWTTENDYYVLGGIDLAFLAGGGASQSPVTFHFTEGCGNDLLMGQTTAAVLPDAGLTLGMLGIGLGAVGFFARRVHKSD